MSYGQDLTRRYLHLILSGEFFENHRPEWLFGMELDFFYPAIGLAVEFQGDQHFVNTVDFGSFWPQRDRDGSKFLICASRGIKLVRLKACDLTYNGVRGKLNRQGIKMKGRVLRSLRRVLDREAAAYRRALVSKFDSVTAVKGNLRKYAKRRKIDAYRAAIGLAPVPIPKRHTRADINPTKVFTLEEIEAGRSPRGGFTRATLKSWGVPWPPPRKWQQVLMRGPS